MNSRSSLLAVLGALTASTVMVSTAHAQQANSVLLGKITDRSSGAPLAGVQVVVTSTSLIGEQTVESDSSGMYRIPNLPAGTYTVQFFMGGYKPFTNPQPVVLRANQTIRFNAPLQAEGAQEINLEIEAPSVDVGSNSSGTNLDEEFIKKIPIASAAQAPTKSFESVAVATPGAQGDTYGTSIAGTTSPENGYRVDGVSVGNPAFGTNGSGISTEFLSEVQVISGGYMPEYGRSTGGTISATTRSGSNEFHGSVWMTVSPGALEGKRKVVKNEGNSIITTNKLRYIGDIGFSVDGPIIRDKLWFGAGVQLARQSYSIRRSVWARKFEPNGKVSKKDGLSVREEVDGTAENYKTRSTQIQAFGKLTYAINQDHRVSVTGFYSPNFSGNKEFLHNGLATGNVNLNGTLDSYGRAQKGSATDVSLNWLATADNKRWTFDTTLALHRESTSNLPRDGSSFGNPTNLTKSPLVQWSYLAEGDLNKFMKLPSQCAPTADGKIPCETQRYSTGGPGYSYERKMNRIQLRHTLGRTFIAAGHHTVKAGIDFEFNNFKHRKGYTGGTFLRDYSARDLGFADVRQYGVLHGPDKAAITPYIDNNTKMHVYGAFIQDSWSIMDKVTLNAGVRYDAINIYGSDGQLFISLPLQFAPRVGLIWDPTQKGKSKLFAQYARYYQGMSLDIADRSGSLESGARRSHDKNACQGLLKNPSDTAACIGSQAPSRYYGSSTGANRLWGATGASKVAVDPDLKPQSSDEISAGFEYNILPSGKIGLYYQKRWLNAIIEDVSRDEAHTYFIANPSMGIATDFPPGERKYDAVQLAFTKTYKDHWLAQASYQWSHTRGNISGLFRPESGQLDPNINSDFDLKSLLTNRFGDLPADRRHEIKAFAGGDYPISDRFLLDGGMAFTARSGAPTSYLGSHLIYGPGESFLLKRGTGTRLPWVFNLNLNLGAVFRVGQTGKIKAGIEVFNIFNLQQVTARSSLFTRDDSLLPVPEQNGKPATEADLDKALTEAAQKLANEKNMKSKAAPGTPDFVTVEAARDQIKEPNFAKPTRYQAPRSFRFTLRYEF